MDGTVAYDEYRPEPRYQIIGGKVVMMASPSPDHNRIVGCIFNLFFNFLRGRPCEPFGDNTDLFLDKENREYKPDMMVVCDPKKIKRHKGIFGAPDLVVEVLSPSTARYDRGEKKDVYERHGVREYWIVDPRTRSIEQYILQNDKFVLRNIYTQFPKDEWDDMDEEERSKFVTEFTCGIFEDLTIRLDDVFARLPKDW